MDCISINVILGEDNLVSFGGIRLKRSLVLVFIIHFEGRVGVFYTKSTCNEKKRWLFEYRFDGFVLQFMSGFVSRAGSTREFP